MPTATVTALPRSAAAEHPAGCRCLRCDLLPLLDEIERRGAQASQVDGPRLVPVSSTKPRDRRPTATATELLGVGKDLVYRLIGRGDLETVKIDGCQLVVVESIDAYVSRLRGES